MTYDEFLDMIKDRAQERLGKLYKVSIEKLLNNNGVMKDTLCVNRVEEHTTPMVYLNAYYDLYQGEMTLDDIMDEILEVYEWSENCKGEFKDFESVKDRIIFRLVNSEKNPVLLQSVPHIHVQDLAVIFCIYKEADGISKTSLIRTENMKDWNTTEQDLFDLAKINTPLCLTAEIKRMVDVVKEIARNCMGDSYSEDIVDELLQGNGDRKPMYVLSNTKGVYGASCILYKDVLKDFSESQNCDLIVLPSSIHEVIIIPDDGTVDIEEVREMVKMVNETEVPEEDYLSNEVYCFSRAEGTLNLAMPGKRDSQLMKGSMNKTE